MNELIPNRFWIGHALDLQDSKSLYDKGIKAVVDVAYEEPSKQLPRNLIYCRFPLMDGSGNDPNLLLLTLKTVVDLLQNDIPTLLGCSAGLSRSPTIAAFSIAILLNKSPEKIIEGIAKNKPVEIKPNFWADTSKAYDLIKLGYQSQSEQ